MGTGRRKQRSQQGQPCLQQLAAIDLVFENFGFKSVARKKIQSGKGSQSTQSSS
jgi:hypothetical protein